MRPVVILEVVDMKSAHKNKSGQQGVMLLEAILAILIFSIGVLAVIGLQTASVKAVSDAKYRADAAFLANQIIGEMWVNKTNLGGYIYAGGTPSSLMGPWVTKVQGTLPGVSNTINNPTIAVGASNTVTITIRWQPPRTGVNQVSNVHNFVVVTSIN